MGYAARIDVTNSLANDAEFDELQQLTLDAKDRLSGGACLYRIQPNIGRVLATKVIRLDF